MFKLATRNFSKALTKQFHKINNNKTCLLLTNTFFHTKFNNNTIALYSNNHHSFHTRLSLSNNTENNKREVITTSDESPLDELFEETDFNTSSETNLKSIGKFYLEFLQSNVFLLPNPNDPTNQSFVIVTDTDSHDLCVPAFTSVTKASTFYATMFSSESSEGQEQEPNYPKQLLCMKGKELMKMILVEKGLGINYLLLNALDEKGQKLSLETVKYLLDSFEDVAAEGLDKPLTRTLEDDDLFPIDLIPELEEYIKKDEEIHSVVKDFDVKVCTKKFEEDAPLDESFVVILKLEKDIEHDLKSKIVKKLHVVTDKYANDFKYPIYILFFDGKDYV
ncbi:hypothetical protein ABK040_007279 [Willaertia magna]